MSYRTLLIVISLATLAWANPEVPGAKQTRPIALVNGTVHPVTNPTISDGVVVFNEGKITYVGTDTTSIPAKAERIDLKGKHVFPGLFNADGVLGLVEINAVRASDDRGEVGRLNMNVRTEVAINPDSELIPVTRSGGVLFNLTAPTRGLITGTSAILQLDGWTTEDITLHAPAALHVTWPRPREAGHHDDHPHEEKTSQIDRLEEVFDQAEQYRTARNANQDQPIDLRLESLQPVLRREIPVVAAANHALDIQAAVAFADRRNLRLIIYGGADAAHCAELLRHQKVPVILSGVYRLPPRRSAAYNDAYTLPERLRKMGVAFCIAGSGRFAASNIRNLPYHAAMAIAFGLPENEALRAITLSPAEILGVADKIGSLEPGKDASLIIMDRDVFDTASNVTAAFLQGREIQLNDRHKRLYKKYSIRQERENGTQ